MSKGKIAILIAGGAINGALAACIFVWPNQAALISTAVGLVTILVATVTGITFPAKPSA